MIKIESILNKFDQILSSLENFKLEIPQNFILLFWWGLNSFQMG